MSPFNSDGSVTAGVPAQSITHSCGSDELRDQVRRDHRSKWEANPTEPFVELTRMEMDCRVELLIAELEQAHVDNWLDAMEAPDEGLCEEGPEEGDWIPDLFEESGHEFDAMEDLVRPEDSSNLHD